MRYLLDTCVISDFIKGEAGTKTRLKQALPVDIAVSAITVIVLLRLDRTFHRLLYDNQRTINE